MNLLLTLPIILPFAGGAAAVFVRKSAARSHRLALVVAGVHTICAGLLLNYVDKFMLLALVRLNFLKTGQHPVCQGATGVFTQAALLWYRWIT